MSERLRLARASKGIERALDGALARTQRERKRGARPRLAVGEQRQYVRVLLLDAPRQHDDVASAARREREASLRGRDVGERAELGPEPSDLHTQPRAMRFVRLLRSERARHEVVPR